MSGNINLFLHKDFSDALSSSISRSRKFSSQATKPNNSAERFPIQKGGVQCTVAAVDISCLLFTILYSKFSVDISKYTVFIFASRLGIFSNFSLRKLINKPDSLLLEYQRSETSSEGHNQTTSLFNELVVMKSVMPLNLIICFVRKPCLEGAIFQL